MLGNPHGLRCANQGRIRRKAKLSQQLSEHDGRLEDGDRIALSLCGELAGALHISGLLKRAEASELVDIVHEGLARLHGQIEALGGLYDHLGVTLLLLVERRERPVQLVM